MNKNIILCLWHSNSRKVAFGLLLFVVATVLAVVKIIAASDWMWCIGACTTLIGGGTIADSLMGKKKEAAGAAPAV